MADPVISYKESPTITISSGNTTGSVNLAQAITLAQTVVIVSAKGGTAKADESSVRVDWTDTDTLTASRQDGAAGTVTLELQVIEFNSEVVVQQHTANHSGSATDTLSPAVTLAESSILGMGMEKSGTNFTTDDVFRVIFNSTTEIAYRSQSTNSGQVNNVQVIDWGTTATTQELVYTLNPTSDTQQETTITSTLSDTTHAFCMSTFDHNNNVAGFNDMAWTTKILSTTQVQNELMSTVNKDSNFVTYVVEFDADIVNVQRGEISTFNGSGNETQTDTITAVAAQADTCVFMGGAFHGNSWGRTNRATDEADISLIAFDGFNSDTVISFSRSATANYNTYLPWEVVEWVGGAGPVTGAPAFDGTSTLAVVGTTTVPGTAAFDGTSTLAVVGTTTVPGSPTFAGLGSLTVTSKVTVPGESLILGQASLSVVSSITQRGAPQFDGTSTLTVIGSALSTVFGTPAFDGTSTLAVVGTIRINGAPQLDGTSTLAVTPTQITQRGTGTFDGTSSLTVTGTTTVPGTVQLDGTSTLTVTGAITQRGVAAFDGTSTLAITGTSITQRGAPALDGTSTLAVTPTFTGTQVDCSDTSNSIILLGFTSNSEGAAQLFAGGDFSITRARVFLQRVGTKTGTISVKLYGTSGSGASRVPGTLHQTSTTTLDESTISTTADTPYEFDFPGTYDMASGTDYFISVETDTAGGVADYTAVSVHTTSGTHAGHIADKTSGTWTADTQDMRFCVWGTDSGLVTGSAAFDGTSSLTVTSSITQRGTALFEGTSTLAVVSTVTIPGTVAMDGTSTLAVTPTQVTQRGTAVFEGTSSLTVIGRLKGEASFAGTSSLTVTGRIVIHGTPALDGTSTLAVTSLLRIPGTASFDGSSSLTVVAVAGAGPTTHNPTLTIVEETMCDVFKPVERACIVSTTAVWNTALVALGVSRVSGTSDNSRQGLLLQSIWADFRKQFLTEHPWAGAKTTQALATFKDSDTTTAVVPEGTRWNYAFALPDETDTRPYLHALYINGYPNTPNSSAANQWEIETVENDVATIKRCLLTNESTVKLQYIWDVGDDCIDLLSPLARQALGLALADFIAPNFGKTPAERKLLKEQFTEIEEKAKGTNSQESTPPMFQNTPLLDAREGGMSF